MKKILLIATGGTIACSESRDGLVPAIGVDKLVSFIPGITDMCQLETAPLMNIDSSNMNPELIGKIATQIEADYDNFDGFVITHGTDTLAYTAAALSYMLVNLTKPVVLTGSQLPIEAAGTDAIDNLCDAVKFACEDCVGVYISFNGKLIDGRHAVKVKSRSFDAFESINYQIVAHICKDNGQIMFDSDCDKHTSNIQSYGEHCSNSSTHHSFHADISMCTDIAIVRLFPGMRTDMFDYILEAGYKGVIIEAYGLGGLPVDESDIMLKLKTLSDAGIAIVITTQCMQEGTGLGVYKVGQFSKNLDIIDAGTMTTENLTMKLMWALAHFDNLRDVKEFMEN